MGFDTSLSQVINWLQDIPICSQPPDVDFDTQSTTKRRLSSVSDSPPAKRRQLPSPPASQRHRQKMEGISTPTKKRLAEGEPLSQYETEDENTPKAAATRRGQAGQGKASSASSQSGSSCSHDSKRSRGSASPMKMWPLVGSAGHQLVRGNAFGLRPPAVTALASTFSQINRMRSIMPKSVQKPLEKLGEDVDDTMFYDDNAAIDMPCGKDLIRLAQRIAKHSNTCSSQLQDEGAWNNLVHTRVLDMFIHDLQNGPGQDQCDFMPCITTNMNLEHHRFNESASRVDYIIRILPDNDEDSPACFTPSRMPSRNWTSNQLLPIAFSIETKRYGGDVTKGEQQLGIWTAAQWEFLIKISSAEAVKELPYIPGVVVSGETWSLVITTRTGVRTTVYPGIPFGNTGTVIGVFQAISGLCKLRTWALETLWPWYQRYLPGLVPPGNSQSPVIESGGLSAVISGE
ncbi:hypothetical protein ACHAP7_011035 [Fusarium lateritium]